MKRTINTGLIGFGMAGKVFHAPFVHVLPGFNLSKISTTNPLSIEHAQKHYPEAEIVNHADLILNDPAIELVFVLTPNETHYPLAKAALLAGKHVVVDKPFTVISREADELIELAKKQGKLLTVYHNRRWAADYITLKKILNEGSLGRLMEYTACYDRYVPNLRPKKWKEEDREGSGVLYDLGSHLIDQVLQLFGLPLDITANIKRQRENTQIDDYFLLTLNYKELTVYLHSGMLVKVPGPNFLIHGDKGSFVKYGQDVQEGDLIGGRMPNASDWGVEPETQWGNLTTESDGVTVTATIKSDPGSYTDFFVNLSKAINGEEELAVKPEDARNVVRVIELSMQSFNGKRTVAYTQN